MLRSLRTIGPLAPFVAALSLLLADLALWRPGLASALFAHLFAVDLRAPAPPGALPLLRGVLAWGAAVYLAAAALALSGRATLALLRRLGARAATRYAPSAVLAHRDAR